MAQKPRDPRASVWLDPPVRRPERAEASDGLDQGRIVRAAVELLDSDGLGRFSMRRLAAELNVTPMSVYWYVETKDDLLEFALDSVFAGVAAAADGDWQGGVREFAGRWRHAIVAHPWVGQLAGAYLNIGPRALELSAAAHRVVRAAGIPERNVMGVLSLIGAFVYGFSSIEAQWAQRCQEAGLDEEEFYRGVVRDMQESGEGFGAEVKLLVDHQSELTYAQLRERDFTVAVDCLIAGIAALAAAG